MESPLRGGAKVIRKITESSVGGIYASMEQAVCGIASLVSTASEEKQSDGLDDGLSRKKSRARRSGTRTAVDHFPGQCAKSHGKRDAAPLINDFLSDFVKSISTSSN